MSSLNSENNPLITEADACSMASLLADVAAQSGDHTVKKRKLLTGLCEMIGAEKWVWVLKLQGDSESNADYLGYLHGGFSPEEYIDLAKAAAHPLVREIDAPLVAEIDVTRMLQLDPE